MQMEQSSNILADFEAYLVRRSLSKNTVTAYRTGVKQFLTLYKEVSPDALGLYKSYLMEHYQPQTVNLRLRALKCFLQFKGIEDCQMRTIRLPRKSYLERVISRADYEYLKTRLWSDEEFTFYFIVRFLAATGVRVSELVTFQTEDVSAGYKDIYSKQNKMRRVYIPTCLQKLCLEWLNRENRRHGPLFLSHLGSAITDSGIRSQLKVFGGRYLLDTHVLYPHSFRHLFAKNFIESGGDIAFLSNLLGHDSIETTRIYLRKTSFEQAKIFSEVVDW